MKKFFSLLVMMCLLGVSRAWAQFNPMSLVVNTGTTIVYQWQLPDYNGGGGNNFLNKSHWELIPSGNISNATFSNDNFDINITYKDVPDSEKGGAITVIFKKNDNQVSYYVITVPYSGNHVWNFEDFDHTGSITQDEGSVTPNQTLHWVQDWKSKPSSGAQNNKHPIMVASPHDSNTEGNYSTINGTNAYYIPETAGLLFETNSRNFGYNGTDPNGTKKYVVWGGRYANDNSGYTPQFKIPQVQGGKYIKVWWDGMAEGGLGAHFKVNNLLDLEGADISNEFQVTGVNWIDGKYRGGVVTFKVKGSSTQKNDVVFKLTDAGWNDLYRIEITDDYSTDMILLQQMGGNKEVKYNNDQGSFVVEESELNQGPHNYTDTDKPYLTYCGASGYAQIERAKSCRFNVIQEPANVVGWVEREWTSGGGAKYYNLDITQIKGEGNIKIIQTVKYGDYVLDKKETWIAFGIYKQQSYPYTWDFMDWNMKQTELYSSLEASTTHGVTYGYWNKEEDEKYSLETHELVNGSMLNAQTGEYGKVDKPLFAQGAQLTYRKTNSIERIAEAEGLRIKQFWGNELGVGSSYDGEITFDGHCMGYTPSTGNASDGHKLVITIPSVPMTSGEEMWVFIKATDKPNSVYAATNLGESGAVPLTSGTPEKCNLADDVWAYKVTKAGDVEILYSKKTSIKLIGVTNIFKSINVLGYATESRNVAIDHEYEGKFTKNDVNAYCIQTYDNTGFTYVYKGTKNDKDEYPEVKKSGRIHLTPANTGIVLYADVNPSLGSQFNVPLFYPACNAKITTTEQESFENNWMAPNVESTPHSDEEEERNGETCTKFIMTRTYYTYNKPDGSSTGPQTSDVQAFYRLRIDEDASHTEAERTKNNTIGANKAYLLIPSAKLPTALWNGGNGQGIPQQAKGVIFIDLADVVGVFDETTDINDLYVKDVEEIEQDVYYTLSGIRLERKPTTKGVYICNGKKVFVK